MTAAHLDIPRLLAADMRPHLDDPAMRHILILCGGVILGDGEEWHVKVAGERLSDTSRADVLSRALDLIANRPDLWPRPPSAA